MRSTFLLGSVAAAATAISATADLTGNPTPWEGGALEHRFVGSSSSFAPGDVRYDAIPGPYSAIPAGDGLRGFSFYEASTPGGDMFLGQMRFVGGTDTVGGIVTFNFYDWAGGDNPVGDLANSFSVSLSSAGNFIWTITLDPGFEIPTLGVVEMVNGTGGLSQWFLTPTLPTVGTAFGSPFEAFPTQAFALVEGVPAPGAIALLGVAGLAGSRRRRA